MRGNKLEFLDTEEQLTKQFLSALKEKGTKELTENGIAGGHGALITKKA